jgi:formate hydrogenlyase subunit 3/multisubunit Na+/H+ antiporter MnhD subunit
MTSSHALYCAELAVSLALLSSLCASIAYRWRPALRYISLPLSIGAGLAAVIAGASILIMGTSAYHTLPLGLPWHPWQVQIDGLSAFFLVIVGALSAVVFVYSIAYVRSLEQDRAALITLGVCSGLFLAGMILVVLAAEALLFMIAWELMSLASYFLVAFHHEQASSRRAALRYLLMAQSGALAILLGFGILAGTPADLTFAAMRDQGLPALWAFGAFALFLCGFGMKAGLVPFHIWLPDAHPAAPAPWSALMSGAMLKVAIYGFLRTVFDLLGPAPWHWGLVLIILGGASALLGALLAVMQTDLKRLLAYSSIDNIGIIFLALGLSLLYFGLGHQVLGMLALMAALYHTLNHAMFKGLLFLGAGAILHSAHERDLEQMGGLLRRMPWTGLFFLIGCAAIAALPPTNGFASEWLIVQTMAHGWQLQQGIVRSIIPLAAIIFALTSAITVAGFVRVYGIAFLGQARSRAVRRARAVPILMRLAQGILAGLCLISALFAAPIMTLLAPIASELMHWPWSTAVPDAWFLLQPLAEPDTALNVVLILLLIACAWLMSAWLWRGSQKRLRRREVWDCGFGPPTPRMQYSATGFSQPIRRVFAPILNSTETITPKYRLTVTDYTTIWLYEPLVQFVTGTARRVAQLQSGHVRHYLGWTLVTLLLLLVLVSLGVVHPL